MLLRWVILIASILNGSKLWFLIVEVISKVDLQMHLNLQKFMPNSFISWKPPVFIGSCCIQRTPIAKNANVIASDAIVLYPLQMINNHL